MSWQSIHKNTVVIRSNPAKVFQAQEVRGERVEMFKKARALWVVEGGEMKVQTSQDGVCGKICALRGRKGQGHERLRVSMSRSWMRFMQPETSFFGMRFHPRDTNEGPERRRGATAKGIGHQSMNFSCCTEDLLLIIRFGADPGIKSLV